MVRLSAALMLACGWSVAQVPSAPTTLRFDVASIKLHVDPLTRLDDFSSSGPRLTLEGYTEFDLITEAYGLKRYQVDFAPAVKDDTAYYDIVAKAPEETPPSRSQFRQMLQSLLAERFALKFHRQLKEMNVYELMVGKNGPKFEESAPDAVLHVRGGVDGRKQYVEASKFTMDMLADRISVDRPVLNKTGLTGAYDVKLEATPEFRMRNGIQPDDIRIFEAVQDQLGLKLVRNTAIIEILVVDHIEKPSAN